MNEEVSFKYNVLYKIGFSKKFFKSYSVKEIFKDEFPILDITDNKTILTAKCYELVKTKFYKEKIIKRYDENYNKFVKLYFVNLKCIRKIKDEIENSGEDENY